MMQLESYLHRGRADAQRIFADPRIRTAARGAMYAAMGFSLSAASLGNAFEPFVLSFVITLTPWRSAAAAAGGALGYLLFWGNSGMQALAWTLLGWLGALAVGTSRIRPNTPLIPALAALIVSISGLGFQIFLGDETRVSVYLLRVALAAGGAAVFARANQRDSPIYVCLAKSIAVFALAQIAPRPWMGVGFAACGVIAVRDTLPASVMAGLAIDLAQVTKTPMTAVLALAYLVRFLPAHNKRIYAAAPAAAYLALMSACMTADAAPILPLLLGGIGASLFPKKSEVQFRSGVVGAAQVRIERMAGAVGQMQQLISQPQSLAVDESALLARTRERACGGCPHRKLCPSHTFPEDILHRKLGMGDALPFPCRKPGRMVLELQRSREHLRALEGEREKREAYRVALAQQYRFLGDYLRTMADTLAQRDRPARRRYQAEVAICSVAKQCANGDRCASFSGGGSSYYVVLCDGMGTGEDAAAEGRNALSLLREMLLSGFSAAHALRSLNSLLVLRGSAGASTVDLAEIDLSNGSVCIYKWGAAPSWLLRGKTAEKIGTASPPPGIAITDACETVDRLSLRRGEVLALCSDGVDAEAAVRRGRFPAELPPGEVAAELLDAGGAESDDDATCAVIRLLPLTLST